MASLCCDVRLAGWPAGAGKGDDTSLLARWLEQACCSAGCHLASFDAWIPLVVPSKMQSSYIIVS